MCDAKEMKIMYDFVIKRFQLAESFQKLKETIQMNFKLPINDFISKYRIYYLNSLTNNNDSLLKESDYKQLLNWIESNKINLVKIFVEEIKADEIEIKLESNSNYNKTSKEKRLPSINKLKKSPVMKLKREVKNLKMSTPSLKMKKRIRSKTKSNMPIKVYSRLRNSIFRKRTIKRGRKSKRQKEVINNNLALRNLKSKRNLIRPFKKEKKFRYKNNVKSDDSKIEKWFLYARFNIRQYKKTEDKNSSYVITYEGKNKIKIQFRIRGPDKKFHCRGKLVNFVKEGYDEKWDMTSGINRMENFLNYSLENFEKLDKKIFLNRF